MTEGSDWLQRQRRAQALFERLLGLPPEERPLALKRATAMDPELREAVGRLLRSDRPTGESPLDQPLVLTDDLLEAVSLVGRRIGPYRLEELLGEGGTGTVYRAERVDGEFEQSVAIKLIRTGLDSDSAQRRIRAERQILATLSHPNVARLLDGGSTDDGQPFVVMEAIAGLPITEYCDQGRLSLARRLELFRGVCDGVHYAHRHLVVHRDLKPSNILVAVDGIPKLLDFGIATILEPAEDGETEPRGLQALTPAYASPEQLTGRAVTTASDVYSLGVLLYELVSGVRPYRRGTDTPLELASRLEREPPSAPSQALRRTPVTERSTLASLRAESAASLARALTGDLDAIVAKAMSSDPGQRYGSAQQLGEELDRFLEGLPVTARAGGWAYRGAKLAGRNPWSVGLAALVLVLSVGFAVFAGLKAGALERERDAALEARRQAETERARAEAITGFLQEAFVQADPGATRGDSLTAREVLESGAARLQTELVDEPDLRAAVLGTLADVYLKLGQYDRAGPLAAQALALQRAAGEPLALAESLEGLGEARLYQQDFAAAAPLFEESLALRELHLSPDDPSVASSLYYLAYLDLWQGRVEEAEWRLARVLEIRTTRSPVAEEEVAESRYLMAQVRQAQGDLAGAERHLTAALDLYRALDQTHGRNLTICLHALGQLLAQRGDASGAEAAYQESLAVGTELLGEHPLVADGLISLASLLRRSQRREEAEVHLRRAVEIYRTAGGEGDDLVMTGLVHLGRLLRDKGDPSAAESVLREALGLAEALLPHDDPWRQSILTHLAGVELDLGAWRRAAARCGEVIQIRRRALETASGADPRRAGQLAESLLLLAEIQVTGGLAGAAMTTLEEARSLLPPDTEDWRVAVADGLLGATRVLTGDPGGAGPLLRSAQERLLRLRPESREARVVHERWLALGSP